MLFRSVGSKIDLDFNIDTLRITDVDEEDAKAVNSQSSASSVLAKVKRNAVQASNEPDTVADEPKMRITAKTDSTKLREFLNNLGT